jgi:hypothetical protein
MERREFLRRMTLGLAAGWALGKLSWPGAALAGAPETRLALLADAHLKDGNELRPEAQALARAVSEIRALQPRPDLVLVAGDLAHRGRPDALDLGKEILSDLPAPLLAVRGEGDGAGWARRFGEPRFSHACRGFHLLGVDTALRRTSQGPVFALGAEQCRWLTAQLAPLDSDTPLIILSHAPLTPIFRPWQQWTKDAAAMAPLLARFRRMICLHGHVHEAGVRDQGPGTDYFVTNSLDYCRTDYQALLTQNLEPRTQNHISLPATAWPLPSPCLGTPARLRPGLGPQGCGFGLAALRGGAWQFHPHLWAA